MKEKIIKILIVCLNIIYIIFKLFPIKKKVTYISRQSNESSDDILILVGKIKEIDNTVKQVVLTKKIERGFFNYLGYIFHMFVQMYHISTSKVVVLDGYCICISVLKHKKNLKTIQMWHALGSFKKFGYSIIDKNDGSNKKIVKTMKMHHNYNYILTTSSYSKEKFKEAFNEFDDNKFIYSGLPSSDKIINKIYQDKIKKNIIEKHQVLNNGKKNILYVPTFRKKGEISCVDIIKYINYDEYNLIIKQHSGTCSIFTDKNKQNNVDDLLMGRDWCIFSDYIITDYSAIIYEVIILNKPLYLYNYDYNSYIKNRGFYIDYEKDIPAYISSDIKKINDAISKNINKVEEYKKFRKKYLTYIDNSSEKISNLIIEILS